MIPIHHPTNYTRNQQPELTANLLQTKIKEAIDRGLFTPYASKLREYRHDSYSTDWFNILEQTASGELKGKIMSLLCFLFATTIDPDINEESKKNSIRQTLNFLSEKELSGLYYTLGRRDTPPIITTNILYYFTNDAWEKTCKKMLTYYGIRESAETFTSWIKEIIDNKWENSAKKQFLSTLFEVIPSSEGDDTLYCFLLNTSLDYQQKLSKVASPIFLNELENLKKKVVELAEGILSANISSSITLIGNQRTYFLDWFYCNALYSDEAFRIAIGLDEKDWQWLENKITQAEIKKNKPLFEEEDINNSLDPISFLSIKWMIQTANLSESAKQSQFSSAINSNLPLRLFFRHASSYIHSKNIPEENYRKFLEVLTPQSLFYYFDSFENSLKEITIKYLVDIEPQKLVSWLQLIVRDRESTSSHTSKEVLCELFRLISRNQSFESIIDLILKTKDTPLKLSIFCALEKNTQIKFLDNIFNDQKEGVQTVAQWIHYCFFEDNLLKPYTTNFFKNNLHALLQESYPQIIQELKTHLNHTPTVESSKENQCFINSLLPIELNLNDPIVRQEEAIKKLGATFLNSNLSLGEKKAYISSIYGDLLANKTQYELLPKLFENLPKKTWPLIFINFEVRMFFKISPKNKHIAKSDLSHWIELSSQTLLHVVDNPYLIDENDWRYNTITDFLIKFYQVNTKFKTFCEVLKRFIEITPVNLFIPTLDLLHNKCFNSKTKKFNKLIIKALDSADIDKSTFILRSIIAQFDRKCNGTALKLYTKSLYNLIWEEAYFSPEEKLTLFASLAQNMGVNFISFFNDLLSTRSELLKILKPIDQEFLELLFCELINIFCFMGSDEKTKFNFFREIYRSYSYADFDVLDLLKNKIRKNERDEIQKWYSSESVVDSFLSSIFSIDLSILHFFNENEFIPILCRKVKEVLTNKYSVSLVELNSLLRDLDELKYKDQFLKELFEKEKKTVKLMEDYFLEDMKTYLSIKNDPELISLAIQLIPEWKKHFTSWVKKNIKDVKECFMRCKDKPSYYEEIELFKSLEKINRLDDFIISLKSDASDDFIRDLEEVLKQYSDSRKN